MLPRRQRQIIRSFLAPTGGYGPSGPTLLAYQKDSGAPAWQSGTDGASYSSPVLATLAGKRQIVVVNQHTVTGHDPADGRILWSHRWGTGDPKIPQPIPI